MYRVIKVLNNNGILVYHVETGKEMILLGNGVGFGKKPTEQIEKLPGAKVYSLVTRRKQESVLKTVNGIRPEFIEATGKIIEEAENVFQKINHEMLLPPPVHYLCHLPDDRLHHVPHHEPCGDRAVQGAQLWDVGAHLRLQLPDGPVLADVLLRPAGPLSLPAHLPPRETVSLL